MGESDKHRAAAEVILYTMRTIALPIAAIAILNSVLLIVAHARRNKHAALRVYTVRILLMVPVNTLAALVALWATAVIPSAGKTVDHVVHFIVEFYESVVIFSFLQFVLACGAGPQRLAGQFKSRSRSHTEESQAPDILDAMAASSIPMEGEIVASVTSASHVRVSLPEEAPPAASPSLTSTSTSCSGSKRELSCLPIFGCRCCPKWQSGRQMLRWSVSFTLSYVIVGILLAVFGLTLLVLPVSDSKKEKYWVFSMYVLSLTQGMAILGLGTLAVNVREEITLLRPYGKFLSVKFVVFFAFWQGLLLSLLKTIHLFDFFDDCCGSECARTVIQNLLISIEMLVCSIVHFYVFPTHDYLKLIAQHAVKHGDMSERHLSASPNVVEVVDVRDIFHVAWQVHCTVRSTSLLPCTPSIPRLPSHKSSKSSFSKFDESDGEEVPPERRSADDKVNDAAAASTEYGRPAPAG